MKSIKITRRKGLILFVISAAVMLASLFGIYLCLTQHLYNKSASQLFDEWSDSVLNQYSIVALSDYDSDFHAEAFAESNFKYGVIQTKDITKVDLNKEENYLYRNFDDSISLNKVHIFLSPVSSDTQFETSTQLFGNASIDEPDRVESVAIEHYYLYQNVLYALNDDVLYSLGEWNDMKDTASDDEMIFAGQQVSKLSEKEYQSYKINDNCYYENGQLYVNTTDAKSVPYAVVSFIKTPVNVGKSYHSADAFGQLWRFTHFLSLVKYLVVVLAVAGACVTLYLMVQLIRLSGAAVDGDGNSLYGIEKWPLDLQLLGFYLIFYLGYILGRPVAYYANSVMLLICITIYVLAFILLGMMLLMSIVANLRAGHWWHRTLTYRLLTELKKYLKRLYHYLSTFKLSTRLTLLIIGLMLVETAVMILTGSGSGTMLIFLLLEKAGIIFLYQYFNRQWQLITQGIQHVADGQLQYKIPVEALDQYFQPAADDINHISLGLDRALKEKMKSERFRTELITNVSHDIKTPLTSIINYIDLLSKRELQDDVAISYIDVLTRQSTRLKKLIEDLIEASKASTGALKVSMTEVDVNVLLTQTIGEFEEQLNQKGIDLKVSCHAEEPVYIDADYRHLWRVFENLMNNIAKYAQPGTRAYIDVTDHEHDIVMTFRNISKEPLNISSEELMERFVRGDSSRNTEGSGLGLSIARSLTELMNGTLNIYIDGDLFKVVMQFPRQ